MEAKQGSDKELVKKLSSGSEEAFRLLFQKYERRLYTFSYKILLSSEDAEEVVQEVFFKIWKNKRLLKEDLSFCSFLFTIAKNHIYNQLSKRVSETAYKHYYLGSMKNQVGYNTEEDYYFEELKEAIKEKVDQMPEKRRKVFIMSRFDGLSNSEIADRQNLTLSTVENHINKALKTLKQHLYIRDYNIFLLFMFLYF